jgi:hypothetical protein
MSLSLISLFATHCNEFLVKVHILKFGPCDLFDSSSLMTVQLAETFNHRLESLAPSFSRPPATLPTLLS